MVGHIVLVPNPIQLIIKWLFVDSRYFARYFACRSNRLNFKLQRWLFLIRTAVAQPHNNMRSST